jgi:hypothetical protein
MAVVVRDPGIRSQAARSGAEVMAAAAAAVIVMDAV